MVTACLVAVAAPASAAADIFVAVGGADNPSCGSQAAPCATIGYAYSVRAVSGDTITVGPGDFSSSNPYDPTPRLSNNLYITKTIHFVGAQAGIDARGRTEGASGETVIYNSLPNNAAAQLWYVAAAGVTIDGFTFDDVTPGPGHYELFGAGGSGGAGVQSSNDVGGTVFPNGGIDSYGWTIVNDIFKMTNMGIYLGSTGAAPSLVQHDLFDDNGGSAQQSIVNNSGVYSDHPLINTTITQNSFTGTAIANTVEIATAFSTPSSGVTISDNLMDGQDSVVLYTTTDTTITGNSMIGVRRGVAIDGNDHRITVSGNNITGPNRVDASVSRNCIQLSNTYDVGQNSDVTIFDNTLDRCVQGGIVVSNTDNVTADYNLITNSGSDGIMVAPNNDAYLPVGTPTPMTTGVNLVRNTITGSAGFGVSVAAGSYTGPMQARFNRIVDNGSYSGLKDDEPTAVIDARWNWWGCNKPDGPGPAQPRPLPGVPGVDYGPGCGTIQGTAALALTRSAARTVRHAPEHATAVAPAAATVSYNPWLVLTIASNPADVVSGQAALVSSALHTDSANGDTTGLTTPPGPYFRVVLDAFSAATGTIAPTPVTLSLPLDAGTTWQVGSRPTEVCSTVDHQTVCLNWALVPAPAIGLAKTASPVTYNAAGDLVTYSFAVTNTGNVPLAGISVTETAFSGTGTLSAVDCPQASLAAGGSETCTATYHVTQADVDAGQVTNTAVAHGTPPSGPAVDSAPSPATVTANQTPAITLVKSASPPTYNAAGDPVAYSFKVTNAGNVTVHGVAVAETAFSGTGTTPAVTCLVTTLAPGAFTTCTAAYSVTQADVDAGRVTNTAAANALDPAGGPVTSNQSSAAVTTTPSPDITLVKTASPATYAAPGDQVTYSFKVTNDGNNTLTGVSVADTAFSGTGTLPAVTCPVTTLAPGAFTTCTAAYSTTQADVDAGQVTNTAVATGLPPTGPAVSSQPSPAVVTASQAPAITLKKSALPATYHKPGDLVIYLLKVTNTGNVTLRNVSVNETAFTGTGILTGIEAGATTLAPGASTFFTARYRVTLADVDAGKVDNTAVAHGTPPSGPAVDSPPASAEVTAPAGPALTLVKSASVKTVKSVGEPVTYSFLVTNTGNVTLTSIAIAEGAFTGTGTLSPVTCPDTTLAPGATVTCTATYHVTQADIDRGKTDNTATATGSPPSGPAATSNPSTAEDTSPAAPALHLVKTASVKVVEAAGARVTYSFKVTNTGNDTLHGITIKDTAFSGAGQLSAVKGGAATLAPGASTTFTATYKVTAADLKAGKIANTALAGGRDPAGAVAWSNPSSAVVKAVAPVVVKFVPAGQDGTAARLIGEDMLIAGLLLASLGIAAGTIALARRRRSTAA